MGVQPSVATRAVAPGNSLDRSTRVERLIECREYLESGQFEAKIEVIESQSTIDPVELQSRLSKCHGRREKRKLKKLYKNRRKADLAVAAALWRFVGILKNRVLPTLRAVRWGILEGRYYGKYAEVYGNQLVGDRRALQRSYREVHAKRRLYVDAEGRHLDDNHLYRIEKRVENTHVNEVFKTVDVSLYSIETLRFVDRSDSPVIRKDYLADDMNQKIPIIVRDLSALRSYESQYIELQEQLSASESQVRRKGITRAIDRNIYWMRKLVSDFDANEFPEMMEHFEILFFPVEEVSLDDLNRIRKIAFQRERIAAKLVEFRIRIEELRQASLDLAKEGLSELIGSKVRSVQRNLQRASGLATDPDLLSIADEPRYLVLKRPFDAVAALAAKRIEIWSEMNECLVVFREQKLLKRKLEDWFFSGKRVDHVEIAALEFKVIEKALLIERLLEEIASKKGMFPELDEVVSRVLAEYLSFYGHETKVRKIGRRRRWKYCCYFGKMRFVPETREKIRHGIGKEFDASGREFFYGRYEDGQRTAQGESYRKDAVAVGQRYEDWLTEESCFDSYTISD